MTLTTAKWTLDDYHRMIDAGILSDRRPRAAEASPDRVAGGEVLTAA